MLALEATSVASGPHLYFNRSGIWGPKLLFGIHHSSFFEKSGSLLSTITKRLECWWPHLSVSSDSVCESGMEWAKSYAKEKKVIFTYMIPSLLMVGPLVLGRTKQTNTLALHHCRYLLLRQRYIKQCKMYSLSSPELQEKLKYRKWVWNMYKYLLVTSTVLCASWLNMNRIPSWSLGIIFQCFSCDVHMQPRWRGLSIPEGQGPVWAHGVS